MFPFGENETLAWIFLEKDGNRCFMGPAVPKVYSSNYTTCMLLNTTILYKGS